MRALPSSPLRCIALLLVMLLVLTCGPAPTLTPQPTPIPVALVPTNTPQPTATPRPTNTPTPTPSPTPTPIPADDLLAQNQAAVQKLKSLCMKMDMEIEVTGQTVTITMDGLVENPNRSYFLVESLGQKIEVVTNGQQVYSRQLESEVWLQTMVAEAGPDYAAQLSFGNFAKNPVVEGEETLDGVATYVVAFDVNLSEFFALDPTWATLFDPLQSTATGKVWIGQEDLLTRKLSMELSMDVMGTEMVMTMDMSARDFDEPVDIPDPSPYIVQKALQVGDPVFEVIFSPDGAILAASDDDQTIYLWSMADLDAEPRTLIHPDLANEPGRLQTADFYSLDFSPDGRTLAAGSQGRVFLYAMDDLAAEPVVLVPEEPKGDAYPDFDAVAFSPDGKYLVAGGAGAIVHVWSTAKLDAPATRLTGHEGEIIDLTFTPDGKTLISAGADAKILLWSMSDLKVPPKVLTGNDGPVYSVEVTPDGKFLLTVGFENPVLAWSLDQLDNRPEVLIERNDPAINKLPTLDIALSPDSGTLASSEVPGTVRLWHMSNLERPFFAAQAHGESDVMTIAFSPDGKYLASGGGDAVVMIWLLVPTP